MATQSDKQVDLLYFDYRLSEIEDWETRFVFMTLYLNKVKDKTMIKLKDVASITGLPRDNVIKCIERLEALQYIAAYRERLTKGITNSFVIFPCKRENIFIFT